MIKEIIASKAAIAFMKKTDPEKLAILQADSVDLILDGQLKEKRSEAVQTVAVPWIRKFSEAFCKRLLADQKK